MMVPWVDQMEHANDRGSRKAVQTIAHENADFEKIHEILTLVIVSVQKSPNFLAGANFIASRRRGFDFK